MTITDHDAILWQHLQGRDPSQTNALKVILLDLPYHLLFRGDFDDTVSISSCDQGIPTVQTQRSEQSVTVSLGTVSGLWILPKHGNFIFPNDFARGSIIFTNFSIRFMSN